MKQSKKGINLLVIIMVVILIIGTPILLFSMNKEGSNDNNNVENSPEVTSNVVLKVYKEGTDKVINTVNVPDEETANKIKQINENLKELPKADIKLAVAREWEITIEEDTLISGNFSEGYCYYYNKDANISKLVKRPEELDELLEEIL